MYLNNSCRSARSQQWWKLILYYYTNEFRSKMTSEHWVRLLIYNECGIFASEERKKKWMKKGKGNILQCTLPFPKDYRLADKTEGHARTEHPPTLSIESRISETLSPRPSPTSFLAVWHTTGPGSTSPAEKESSLPFTPFYFSSSGLASFLHKRGAEHVWLGQ